MKGFIRDMHYKKLLALAAMLVAGAFSTTARPQVPEQVPNANDAGSQTQGPLRRKSNPPPDVPLPARPLTSELTRDNLNLVGANVYQLKAVFAKDTGLMVELKRWIAKDASDNGQVLADKDLTDDAVYDRLAHDARLRGVATRLVQRYGYLRPSINPDSDMGKEQEFVLKERARKFVEKETQEEQEADQLQKARLQGRDEFGYPCRANTYDPNGNGLEDSGCYVPGNLQNPSDVNGLGQNNRRNQQQPAAPDQGNPSGANAQTLRAQLNNGSPALSSGTGLLEGAGGSATSGSESLGMSGMPGGASSLVGGSGGGEQFDVAALDPNVLNRLQGTGGSPADISAMNNDRADAVGTVVPYRSAGAPRNRETPSVEAVHQPNPYADIPSLYDLYVQAPSRNGTPQRFGSQVFRDGLRNLRALPMDLPVGPDYVVGPGDSLAIDMWGGVSQRLVRLVDREGRVSLPETGPVQVSGRTLGEVQSLVQKALASQFRDTSADVSVSRLRTVRVYVVGEVSDPGAYDISSLSTPLNALVAAGGVSPRGSLRLLKHYHGRQLVEIVDTYDLLLHGETPDAKKLDNGDTLLIPPVGAQVTVTGMVRRPAIYELHDEKTLADALELAGGILPAATLKHVEVQRLEAHEKRTMLSLDLSAENNGSDADLTSFKIKDGDEIHIFPIAPYNQDMIYVQGHVLRPGKYSYREGMKLTDIITSYKDLLPEPAAHYGEIVRLNAPDFRPSVVSFDLAAALKDPASAPALQPLDTVRVFSRFDFEPAPVVSVAGEVRAPGTYKTSGQASLRDAVFLAGGLTPDASLDSAQLFRVNADGTSKIFSVNLREAMNGSAGDNILLEPRDRLLIHRNTLSVDASTVEITGEVAKPGRYPYTGNMHAEDLIGAAGGLKLSADPSRADLTRYAASAGSAQHIEISPASLSNGNATEDVPLRGGDVLAIRQVPGWKDIGASVKVGGEVLHPSTYGIQPGERLSSVLARAGGFTKNAYPYGALLMRRDVREVELKSQIDLISRIKSERVQLKSLPETDQDQKNAKLTAIAETDATLEQLATRDPVGRVVIHIQKDAKNWKNSPADVTLRDGDELFIPKNPGTILVTGQVFNPTAIGLQAGHSARWYLSQAGGLTPMADKKGVFVIRADGSVIAAKNNNNGGWWSGDPLGSSLRPGDTVVVPEKALKVGGPNWQTVLQTGQLLSSIAIAIAYIHP